MRQRKRRNNGTLLLAALLAVAAGGIFLRSLSHELIIENHSKLPVSVTCGDVEARDIAGGGSRRLPRAVFGLSAECGIWQSGADLKCSTPLGLGSSLRIELRENGVLFCGEWD